MATTKKASPVKRPTGRKVKTKAAPVKKAATKTATNHISVWEQDPASGNQPDGGILIQVTPPNLSATNLPTAIRNPGSVPAPKLYRPGTLEFRYWTAAASLGRGSAYWSKILPSIKWQQDVGSKLKVGLDEGNDLNAYYDRQGLSFFHGMVDGRTIYSGESPDVICHEQGHAVLDAIKPQLWDAASIEVGAFHESFGDMSSILCALQLPSMRRDLITETGGALYRSTKLSRLAEQLGWAIRHDYPTAVDPDCLRNAVNSLFYRDPQTLPSSAPANSLSSEPHSFSRVFTSAFFEGLAGMFKTRSKKDEAGLLQVSQDMGQILTAGIKAAAVVPSFYSQVAANMLIEANASFRNSGYGQALKSAFVRHGILTLAASNIISRPETLRGFAAVEEADQGQKELPKLNLSIAEYGLGVDNILVHAAEQPRRFNVSGAALSIGGIEPPSGELAAKSFVEDLLRRGRLKVSDGGRPERMGMTVNRVNAPETHDTFTHELKMEGNNYVLRRLRIDCGLHG